MRLTLVFLVLFSSAVAAAQTPVPAPATTATTVAARNADYQLGPGDTVKVTVFDEAALTGSYRIDPDGTFGYPLLDRVKAAGRTTGDIRDEIQKRLAAGFVQRPQVAVEIDQFRPRHVSIAGQVRSPGRLALVGQMTLLEALAQAGYVTDNAGSEIHVLHQPETGAAAGKTTIVRLTDLQANRPDANIILKEGDLVLVQEAEKLTISGHVRSPGQVVWERNMTVRIAIALAGGVTEKGSTRGMRVYRIVKGKPQWTDIDQDDLVQPGDIIEIRQRRL